MGANQPYSGTRKEEWTVPMENPDYLSSASQEAGHHQLRMW